MLIAAIALLSVFASCAGSEEAIAKLVPEDALLYAQVSNPELFLSNTDAFIANVGLSMFMGGKNLESTLASVPDLGWSDLKKAVDLKRPLGMVMSGASMDNPSIRLLVPVIDIKSLTSLLESKNAKVIGPFNGYAVVFPNEGEAPVYPLAKHMDISLLKAYPAHSVAMIMSYNKIFTPEMLSSLDEESGPAKPFIGIMKDMIASMDKIAFAVAVDGKTVSLKEDLTYVKGSAYEKMGTMYGEAGRLAYLPRLTTSEMLGVVSNAAIKDTAIFGSLMKPLFTLIGISETDGAAIIALVNESTANFGGQGFASIDVDYQGPADAEPLDIMKGLSLNVTAASDLKSSDTAKAQLKKGIDLSNTLITSIMAKLMAAEKGVESMTAADLPVTFSFALLENQNESGVAHDQIQFSYLAQDPAIADETSFAEGMDLIRKLIDTRIAYKDNVQYFSMGTNSLENLKAIQSATPAGKSISSMEAYKALSVFLHEKPSMVMHINIARIANMVSKNSGTALNLNEDVPGLLASVAYTEKSTGISMVVSNDELRNYIMPLLPLLMGAQ